MKINCVNTCYGKFRILRPHHLAVSHNSGEICAQAAVCSLMIRLNTPEKASGAVSRYMCWQGACWQRETGKVNRTVRVLCVCVCERERESDYQVGMVECKGLPNIAKFFVLKMNRSL